MAAPGTGVARSPGVTNSIQQHILVPGYVGSQVDVSIGRPVSPKFRNGSATGEWFEVLMMQDGTDGSGTNPSGSGSSGEKRGSDSGSTVQGDGKRSRVSDYPPKVDAAPHAKREIAEPEESTEADEKVRGRMAPGLPPLEVQRAHAKTHIPFRSWCRHCVEGRLAQLPHHPSENREEGAVPEVHLDYAFFRNSQGGETVPILVLKG